MIAKGLRFLCLALMTFSFVSCCSAWQGNTINNSKIKTANGERLVKQNMEPSFSIIETGKSGIIYIKRRIDLQGQELVIEEGHTLVFEGGSFNNGTIRGNNTRIIYKEGSIFNNIRISGTWVVKNITTDMFRDLNYVNSLADVLALTNGDVENNVEIKDYGYDYLVSVSSVGVYAAPLKIYSNTNLQLDGNISLVENNLFQYRIMLMNNCRNVTIKGNGCIKGDRALHDYRIDKEHNAWRSHEWGHGIKISNSQNIEIFGISVIDCTGDSFSIGENSKNILLHEVTAKGSRRQGVTIAVASNVTIDKCIFQNIGTENGTAPGAAVDVEPDNTECEVNNILIRDCVIQNCRNGIVSYSKGYGTTWTESVAGESVVRRDGRHYVNIKVDGCSVIGVCDAFSLIGWDMGEIMNCYISDVDLFLRNPKNLIIRDNEIDCRFFMPHNTCVENCEFYMNSLALKTNTEIILKNSIWNNNNATNHLRIIVRTEE